jgi:hypothetical protein
MTFTNYKIINSLRNLKSFLTTLKTYVDKFVYGKRWTEEPGQIINQQKHGHVKCYSENALEFF